MRFNSNSLNNSKGAVFTEFIIVFPVFILIVLACIELSRYRFAQGILDSGAQQGISLAATIPGLDSDDVESDDFTEAIASVREQSNKLVSVAFVEADSGATFEVTGDPVIRLPAPNGGETRADALQRLPMEITIPARYNPMFPFLPAFEFEGKAVGYREPRQKTTMPVPVDCVGNLFGSDDYFNDCPCDDPRKVWDSYDRQCECSSSFYNSGSSSECECRNDNFEITDTGCECEVTSCPFPQIFSTKYCECYCPSGMESDGLGGCRCKNDRHVINDAGDGCECPSVSSCGPDQVWDSKSCECRCSDEVYRLCEESGGTFNWDTCDCDCDSGGRVSDGAGGCACPDITCVAPQVQDSESCLCTCTDEDWEACEDTGGIFDGVTCACTCPDGKSLNSEGECVCDDAEACGANWIPDGVCGCRCPSPYIVRGERCLPPECAGATCVYNPDTDSCFCPEG